MTRTAALIAALAIGMTLSTPASAASLPDRVSVSVQGNNNRVSVTSIVVASRETIWTHNGSFMRLSAHGRNRQFFYVSPKEALRKRGVSEGTLLFDGVRNGDTYEGVAHIFTTLCGKIPYHVSGEVSEDSRTVELYGEMPILDRDCNIIDTEEDRLVFELIPEQ